MHRSFWKPVVGLLICAAACHPVFQASQYRSNEALYEASMRAFNRHKWGDAVIGFDKLTLDLPARDTLLPRSYWYLGLAEQHNADHVLAAESFSRLAEAFPDDSLAPSAMLRSAREYAKLWPKTALDAGYGETAMATYDNLLKLYPSATPQLDTAKIELAALEDRFAQKDYNTAMFYQHDKAYYSALIYFRDVIAKYPDSPTARLTALRMLEAFRAISYGQDAADLCVGMRGKYPKDAEIEKACPAPAAPATRSDSTLSHRARPLPR